MPMRLGVAFAVVAGALASAASAQSSDRVVPANLQWKEIVPGAQFAAAYGDWEKGAHGKFVRFVKGVQIPLHRHTNDYHAVAISGRIVNLFEGGRRVEIAPGDYFYMAARRAHSHECLSDEGCLFYTYGNALWDFVPYEAPAQGPSSSERANNARISRFGLWRGAPAADMLISWTLGPARRHLLRRRFRTRS